jgi:hypothetical protein
VRDAGTNRNGADVDVAVIDVPAVMTIGVPAAGEDRHRSIEARFSWAGNRHERLSRRRRPEANAMAAGFLLLVF